MSCPSTVEVELSPGRSAARTHHWGPLLEWCVEPERDLPADALELIEVPPEDPRDRVELLHLALIAVSLDRTRLLKEFELRAPLDLQGGPSASDLADYQANLTVSTLGTSGPLGALDAAMRVKIERAAPALTETIHWEKHHLHLWSEGDLVVAWSAALRFSALAHDLGCMLGLQTTIPFRRFLRLAAGADVSRVMPNAVSCFNEPWMTGPRRVEARRNSGCDVFEMYSPAAGIVAVAHHNFLRMPDGRPSYGATIRPRRHPSREVGESGHPVLAAVPPLTVEWAALAAPTRSSWEHVACP